MRGQEDIMRKVMLSLGLALIALACDPYYEVDARFYPVNRSPDHIGLIVNGQEVGGIIAPNRSSAMEIKVPVTLRRGSTTGIMDETAQVAIAIYNFDRGTTSRVVYCTAGAKVAVSVEYEIHNPGEKYERESLRCRSLR